MEKKVNIEEVKAILTQYMGVAEEALKDNEKVTEILGKVSEKFKTMGEVGAVLQDIPVMVSFVSAYIKKEYTEVPVGSIVAIIAALLYVLNHFDLIPDSIPVVGLLDDAAVVALALGMVRIDLDRYKERKAEQVAKAE